MLDESWLALKWEKRAHPFRNLGPGRNDVPEESGGISGGVQSTQRTVQSSQELFPSDRSNRSASQNLEVSSAQDVSGHKPKSGTNPLGITVLHAPDDPVANLVFVHGLGGTSQHTWSKNKDLKLFWPKEWLKLEPDIQRARILTFGYNANFHSPGGFVNILDFAKSLLFEMRFGKDEKLRELKLGIRPIIFIAHSMGGLIVKKAYLHGLHDDEYKGIISQVRAIVFLSSPHRGADLAGTLNRLLSLCLFKYSSQQYISDLARNSRPIEDINDLFRSHSARLQLFSFYETQKTFIGLKRIIIVKKDSSTIGLPGEVSIPLNADHHDVCKFHHREDPNYKSIRSVLQTLVAGLNEVVPQAPANINLQNMTDISRFLSLNGPPYDDLTTLLNCWRPGTCQGLPLKPEFRDWMCPSTTPRVLWLYGQPGCGKSVKSAYIINHIIDIGLPCCYYFFAGGDSTRMSLASLLKSFAYQSAEKIPDFANFLAELGRKGLNVDRMDARILWERLFVAGLLKLEFSSPLYWIIDGLDETNSLSAFFGLLSTILMSNLPFRILVASRKTPEISLGFERIPETATPIILSAEENTEDLKIYASEEISLMYGSVDFRDSIIDRVIRKAQGNFLWVRFVLEEIKHCYSEKDIQEILSSLPRKLEGLYQQMSRKINALQRPSYLTLARTFLAWAIFSRRRLKADELLQALKLDFDNLTDLKGAINYICGDFVFFDAQDRLVLIHQTAREYLIRKASLPFQFGEEEIQEKLLRRCIDMFMDEKAQSNQMQLPPFYEYAATSWPYHLSRIGSGATSAQELLYNFFTSDGVLSWIKILARATELKVLLEASTAIRMLTGQLKDEFNVNALRPERKAELITLNKWALDLVKLGSKFTTQLLENPDSIEKYIPQYCPKTSMLYHHFGNQTQISVSGITQLEWDNMVTRLAIRPGESLLKIVSSNIYVAILTSSKAFDILIWDSVAFQVVQSLSNNEYVSDFCFSHTGEFIASYSRTSTKIWNVSLGHQTHNICNDSDLKAQCMKFTRNDIGLRVSLQTGAVLELSMTHETPRWQEVQSSLGQQDKSIEGAYLNSPTTIAFNSDASCVAVGYRNFPLTIWMVGATARLKRCDRRTADDQVPTENWSSLNRVIWHPNDEEILGLYTDGAIFKWNVNRDRYTDLKDDLQDAASDIRINPLGNLFATYSVSGIVKVYDHASFRLIHELDQSYCTGSILQGICFSQDSEYLYTIRGSDCEIWDIKSLKCLPPLNEITECSSGATMDGSILAKNSASHITSLCPNPRGGLVCIGHDDGLVQLQSVPDLVTVNVRRSRYEQSIDLIVWTDDGSYFAYTDHAEFVIGKIEGSIEDRIDRRKEVKSNIRSTIVAELKNDEGKVGQLLLSSEAKLLVVVYPGLLRLWSIGSSPQWKNVEPPPNSLIASCGIQVYHPMISNDIAWFGLKEVITYRWDDLGITNEWQINTRQPVSQPSTGEIVAETRLGSNLPVLGYLEDVIISTCNTYALLIIFEDLGRKKQWSRLEIIMLSTLKDPETRAFTCLDIPGDVRDMIQWPLNILKRDRLVFLDKSNWVCTWRLGSDSGSTAIVRHFFLPNDWVSAGALRLCRVMADGTFLCPRKGEMGVIRSDLGRDW